jgi:hypothetical protein
MAGGKLSSERRETLVSFGLNLSSARLGFLDPPPEALQLSVTSVNVIFVLDFGDFYQRGYSQL